MKSESQSLTDLRAESEIQDDIDVIQCSNISYVSTTELLGSDSSSEDHPVAIYEDIDAIIPLPPQRNDVHAHKAAKPSHHSPLSGQRSSSLDGTNSSPELPPKNCYLDHRGRRRIKASPPPVRAKSPLIKTLSSSSSASGGHAAHSADAHLLSSPDSPTDKELREIEELEESRDAVEPYYVKKMVFSDDEEEERERQRRQVERDARTYEPVKSPLSVNGEEEELEEPDVGGVDEYVTMGSVINGAWETSEDGGGENVCKSKTEGKGKLKWSNYCSRGNTSILLIIALRLANSTLGMFTCCIWSKSLHAKVQCIPAYGA